MNCWLDGSLRSTQIAKIRAEWVGELQYTGDQGMGLAQPKQFHAASAHFRIQLLDCGSNAQTHLWYTTGVWSGNDVQLGKLNVN